MGFHRLTNCCLALVACSDDVFAASRSASCGALPEQPTELFAQEAKDKSAEREVFSAPVNALVSSPLRSIADRSSASSFCSSEARSPAAVVNVLTAPAGSLQDWTAATAATTFARLPAESESS